MKYLAILALFAAQAAYAQDCMAPWGEHVRNGAGVRAWNFQVAPRGFQCQFEVRVCRNGELLGSFMHQDCIQTPGAFFVK